MPKLEGLMNHPSCPMKHFAHSSEVLTIVCLLAQYKELVALQFDLKKRSPKSQYVQYRRKINISMRIRSFTPSWASY